ncbi:hypothetical protein ACS0TY_004373 [Phlomoides rotata]
MHHSLHAEEPSLKRGRVVNLGFKPSAALPVTDLFFSLQGCEKDWLFLAGECLEKKGALAFIAIIWGEKTVAEENI